MVKDRCVGTLFVLACAALLMTGCKLAGIAGSGNEVASANSPALSRSMAPAPARIIYRTKTDRLNVAGSRLPPCSMATLQLQVPHPHHHYKSNMGYAKLLVLPCSVDSDLKPGELPQQVSAGAQVWEGEVPTWQIDAVIQQLKDDNFFRRAKILGADAFVAVQTDDKQLAKPYRSVPELDAILVRTCEPTDAPLHGTNGRPELARLPSLPAH